MLDAAFEVRRREFQVAVELHLEAGQRVSMLGPSGAGKTTVLETLAGLVPMRRGEIRLEGRLISAKGRHLAPPGRRQVGLVSQTSALFPHLTVLQNLAYPRGSDLASARQRAARLGLTPLLGARPGGLSEGERRRVALARTLQAGGRLLCFDEPFSALDQPLAQDLMSLLLGELGSFPGCAILVTHRLEEAQAFSDRLVVLDRGRVLQKGDSREVVLMPGSVEVARLVGYRGWLRRGGDLLAVHPELVREAGEGEGLEITAEVASCHARGTSFDLALEAVGQWRGRFHAFRARPAEVRDSITVTVPRDPVFPAEGSSVE